MILCSNESKKLVEVAIDKENSFKITIKKQIGLKIYSDALGLINNETYLVSSYDGWFVVLSADGIMKEK